MTWSTWHVTSISWGLLACFETLKFVLKQSRALVGLTGTLTRYRSLGWSCQVWRHHSKDETDPGGWGRSLQWMGKLLAALPHLRRAAMCISSQQRPLWNRYQAIIIKGQQVSKMVGSEMNLVENRQIGNFLKQIGTVPNCHSRWTVNCRSTVASRNYLSVSKTGRWRKAGNIDCLYRLFYPTVTVAGSCRQGNLLGGKTD